MVIPTATNPANRGNLRLKSLSLREVDLSNSLSLSVDLNVASERLQITAAKGDGSTINMFSALGQTFEVTTLSVSSILASDISASGNLTSSTLSVGTVTSGLSISGDITGTKLSVQNAYFEHVEIFGSNTLSVSGKVFFDADEIEFAGSDGTFIVERVISVGNTIVTGSDISVGGNVTTRSFLSTGSDLTVGSYVSVASYALIGGYTQIKGDLSIGGQTTSLQNDLSVGGVAVISGITTLGDSLSTHGDITTSSTLSVAGAVRLSSRLNVLSVCTIHGTMSTAGAITAANDLSVGSKLICSDLSVASLATLGSLSAGSSTIQSLNVQSHLSIAGNLIVEGTTTTLNTHQVDIEDPIIEIGNGADALAGVKIIKDSTESNDQAGIFREAAGIDGTPAFFAVYEDFNIAIGSENKEVGNLRVAQLSTASGSATFLGGTLSVGGRTYIQGNEGLVMEGGLSIQGAAQIEGTLSTASHIHAHGHIMNLGSLSTAGDIVASGFLSVQQDADVVGRTQLAGTLSVASDVILRAGLSVGGDLQVDSDQYIAGSLSINEMLVAGSTLSTASHVTTGGDLSVHGSVVLSGSLSVSDVAVLTASAGSKTFVLNSIGTITLTPEGSEALYVMEFDEAPVQVTAIRVDRTSIEFTTATSGSSTAPPIVYNASSGKYELFLQYKSGITQPVAQPSSFIIEMPRPYSTKFDFIIKNVSDNSYIHNAENLIDCFTIDSGQVVPTISVSGDIVVGSSLSVGHDLQCSGNTLFSNAVKRVGIEGQLSVHGDVNANRRLVVGGVAGSFVSVGSNMVVADSLSVGSQAVFTSEISAGAPAFFQDQAVLASTMSVGSSATITGYVELANTLSVQSDVVLSSGLSVGLDVVLTSSLSVGDATTSKKLSVQDAVNTQLSVHTAYIDDSIITHGTSDLQGIVQLGSTLSVAADVYMTQQLSVGGESAFASGVYVNGSLSVHENVIFDKELTVSGALAVEGQTVLNDVLSVASSTILSDTLSVASTVEISGHSSVRGMSTINNRLSVGKDLTVGRHLSVADTITGGRDLSVGHLVLDRTRTHNRYYLNTVNNSGIQVTSSAQVGTEFIFSSGVIVNAFTEQGEVVVRSNDQQVEWIEVPVDVTHLNILSITDLADNSAAFALDHSRSLLAGTTALSVGHSMTIGIQGQSTFLSVGSTMDVTGRTQMGSSLSVQGNTTLASHIDIGGNLHTEGAATISQELSVGANMAITGYLSVGNDASLRSDVSVGGGLDVVSNARLAASLSVQQDMDVVHDTRLRGSLSVQGYTTIDNDLSVSGNVMLDGSASIAQHLSVGQSATVGDYLSVNGSMTIGSYAQVQGYLSVSGAVSFSQNLEVSDTLSVQEAAYFASDLSTGGGMYLQGDAVFANSLSLAQDIHVAQFLSIGGQTVMNSSLSVASMLALPEAGENTFTFHEIITSEHAATSLRIELAHPHVLNLLTTNGPVGMNAAVLDNTTGTYVSTYLNSLGITDSVGQITGFSLLDTQNAAEALRYMTVQDILSVKRETGGQVVVIMHDGNGLIGLNGGRRAPSLSVGGRIVVLEDLSVGFNTTIQGSLSVSDFVLANTLSAQNAFTSVLSTNTLYVVTTEVESLTGTNISVANAFFDTIKIDGSLSVQGPVTFQDNEIRFKGENLTLDQNLSVGGQSMLNLLSVATAHINMLSVNTSVASELSVHTLFVQQVSTNDPDESFGFQDDAVFQGDLTIEGKLFVKDILYTGPGGAFSIDNVLSLTVQGMISTSSLCLDITDAPGSSTDPGDTGVFTVDGQYLYVCVAQDTWRRVTMSVF